MSNAQVLGSAIGLLIALLFTMNSLSKKQKELALAKTFHPSAKLVYHRVPIALNLAVPTLIGFIIGSFL